MTGNKCNLLENFSRNYEIFKFKLPRFSSVLKYFHRNYGRKKNFRNLST